jgi:hypothetical protein
MNDMNCESSTLVHKAVTNGKANPNSMNEKTLYALVPKKNFSATVCN